MTRQQQLAQDHQATATVLLTRALTVAYLNPAAEALLKTSRQSATGQSVDTLFSDTARPSTVLLELLEDNQSTTNRDADLILKDGTHTRVDYSVIPIPHEDLILVELLELNRLLRINREDRQNEAHETSQKLVRGLAHEVKNPLGGIRGAAQLLSKEIERCSPGLGLREYTGIIIEEADRLTALVDQMLGPMKSPALRPTNVHRTLARVSKLIAAEFGERIEFRRDYDPSLPEFPGDEDLLVQALLNVVRNAAQALSDTADPTITLRTRIVRQFTIGAHRHRHVACIEVIDNGPGIPEELMDRVFYPMISGRAEGTGLGLSIAQQIIARHGGALECESRPGHTCFAVYLPASTEPTTVSTSVR